MPEKTTLKRAREDKAEGKAPSTQAGEFVHEEIKHVRKGKHGARSTKQAIAIGLSKARRAGVKLRRRRRTSFRGDTRIRRTRAAKRTNAIEALGYALESDQQCVEAGRSECRVEHRADASGAIGREEARRGLTTSRSDESGRKRRRPSRAARKQRPRGSGRQRKPWLWTAEATPPLSKRARIGREALPPHSINAFHAYAVTHHPRTSSPARAVHLEPHVNPVALVYCHVSSPVRRYVDRGAGA
jgi:hypothetical protein